MNTYKLCADTKFAKHRYLNIDKKNSVTIARLHDAEQKRPAKSVQQKPQRVLAKSWADNFVGDRQPDVVAV